MTSVIKFRKTPTLCSPPAGGGNLYQVPKAGLPRFRHRILVPIGSIRNRRHKRSIIRPTVHHQPSGARRPKWARRQPERADFTASIHHQRAVVTKWASSPSGPSSPSGRLQTERGRLHRRDQIFLRTLTQGSESVAATKRCTLRLSGLRHDSDSLTFFARHDLQRNFSRFDRQWKLHLRTRTNCFIGATNSSFESQRRGV